jgi:hypothetical protein
MFEGATHECDVRPGFGERARDTTGNAGAAAGHEGDASLQDSISEY